MYSAKFKYIRIDDLEYDRSNPRFSITKQSEDEKIINQHILDDLTLELMQAIGENGFFEGEQLLVVPIEDEKY